MYTLQEVLQFVEEEDVKFIRLTYFDVFGIQKNVSILPSRLPRAMEKGIAIDASAVAGFENDLHTDLFLRPDPTTLTILPWRSMDGSVIYMICDIYWPDGSRFEYDCRWLLRKAIRKARRKGIELQMAAKFEFYLFLLDEAGANSKIPFDQAGYMDVAPLDKGENVRRDICLTLEEMGLAPYKSFHQAGPGQNEIDFHFSDALRAADEASIFRWVVRTSALSNGLYADFSPYPIEHAPGNSMHVQMRFFEGDPSLMESFCAGILRYAPDCTLFANPLPASYQRLGKFKAPMEIGWSQRTRFAMLRIPPMSPDVAEMRSPDCAANPYLVFTLLIEAGLKGIEQDLALPLDIMDQQEERAALLPSSLDQAAAAALASPFLQEILPQSILNAYCKRIREGV